VDQEESASLAMQVHIHRRQRNNAAKQRVENSQLLRAHLGRLVVLVGAVAVEWVGLEVVEILLRTVMVGDVGEIPMNRSGRC
jgi:high-affinity Fe2+/Pb2+ permease